MPCLGIAIAPRCSEVSRAIGAVAIYFWQQWRDEAVLRGVRIHDLRHRFASYAASMSETLPMISKLLGHAKIAVYGALRAPRRWCGVGGGGEDWCPHGTARAPGAPDRATGFSKDASLRTRFAVTLIATGKQYDDYNIHDRL